VFAPLPHYPFPFTLHGCKPSPTKLLFLSQTKPNPKVALIWDSPLAGRKAKFTYRQLRDEVAKFAACLDDQGVKMGDRVMIYMPMIPQAVVAMLAAARIGAVHSVVFGGESVTNLSQ